MLHMTNGECAAEGIRALGLPGKVLAWNDVLHDGPVPAGISGGELAAVRASYIAGRGWADRASVLDSFTRRDATLASSHAEDEVVLWFEHDLYDQLQLIQVLDRLADWPSDGARLSLVQADDYLGPAPGEVLAALFRGRRAASAEQLRLAREVWEAFRAPAPNALQALADADTSALRHLGAALRRHLQQFPSVRGGLSRSERQALEAVAPGGVAVRAAFVRSQAREEAQFLGDASFFGYLEGLSAAPHPLVTFVGGETVTAPRSDEPHVDFLARSLVLTDVGRAVLDGREDNVRLNGIDRWLGGVHLDGGEARWRWDEDAGCIVVADTTGVLL
jgi:hypothetical protein